MGEQTFGARRTRPARLGAPRSPASTSRAAPCTPAYRARWPAATTPPPSWPRTWALSAGGPSTSARPRSGADVGREVLAGEGGAGGDEVGGCALEDDPAAVVAGAGAEVDDPVGVRHDRLVVLDDDDRLAGVDEPVEQAEQLLDVGEVEAGGRLVEDVDAALLGHVGGQLEPLPLAAGQRGERLAEAEVAEPDVGEPVEDLVRGRRAAPRRRRRTPRPRSPTSRAPR